MAAIYFCGATGKMFRGAALEHEQWQACSEVERPAATGSCYGCALYLFGKRQHQHEPYRWNAPEPRLLPIGIIVAGPGGSVANRRRCGAIVRAQRTTKDTPAERHSGTIGNTGQ